MNIEIINSHFSALETIDTLKEINMPFIFNNDKGELDANTHQVLIVINSLNDLFKLQQDIGCEIIISDYQADNGTTTMFLLIYNDYLE